MRWSALRTASMRMERRLSCLIPGRLMNSAGSTNTIILDPIGRRWVRSTCVVTAEEAVMPGVGIETLSTSIINTDPTVFDISITPNTGIHTGTEVSCLASGDDLNDGPLTPDYDWSVSGNVIGTGSTISSTL